MQNWIRKRNKKKNYKFIDSRIADKQAIQFLVICMQLLFLLRFWQFINKIKFKCVCARARANEGEWNRIYEQWIYRLETAF